MFLVLQHFPRQNRHRSNPHADRIVDGIGDGRRDARCCTLSFTSFRFRPFNSQDILALLVPAEEKCHKAMRESLASEVANQSTM